MPKTHPFTVEFVSVWDGGYEITSSCELDLDTFAIVDIKADDVDDIFDNLDSRHINVTVRNQTKSFDIILVNKTKSFDVTIGNQTKSFEVLEYYEFFVDEDEKERLFDFIQQ